MTLTKKPESRPAPNSWGLVGGDNPWEYAPAPEATDHVRIEPEYGLFIGNEFRPSKPRKSFTVINPATEEPLAKVAHASKADDGIRRGHRSCTRPRAQRWLLSSCSCILAAMPCRRKASRA